MVRAVTILFFFFITLLTTIEISFCDRNSDEVCIESERQALVSFKQGLRDPSNRLSSWAVEKDCCKWAGVVCDNVTSHVKELHLQNPEAENIEASMRSKLGGKINSALLNLKHLSYLDLSCNDFGGIQIPSFVGSLGSLRYLDFSGAGFAGMTPHQLGNLSNLRYLRLGGISHDEANDLYAENLGWLSGLSSLEHLDLSGVDLSKESDWPRVLNILPSLIELHMSYCGLHGSPSLPHVNFTSLAVLNISGNSFNSLVPKWVFSLTSLISLDLSFCNFFGPIPSGLRNMTDLTYLDFSSNHLDSTIPNWLYSFTRLEFVGLGANKLQGIISSAVGNLTSLTTLELFHNQLEGTIPTSLGSLRNLKAIHLSGNSISGPIPESLGNLSKLENLYIEDNKLEGVVSEVHFANLTNLKYLYAAANPLVLKASPNWIPHFQLEAIRLTYWHLGPQFPMWLKSQKHLQRLDLSCTGISDTIPTWFWNLSSQYFFLNLSHNQIYGEIPYIPGLKTSFSLVYLSSNQFRGPLPRISWNITELDLSNNSFSGNISHFLCNRTDEPYRLKILDLGENLLSGEIPDCWTNWQWLEVINLGNNNLVGNIPNSMGYLYDLRSLHLNDNSFSGEIPLSLQNCTKLVALELRGNEFVGSIPTWMGISLSNLTILSLRSNKFSGKIPPQLCYPSSLQIMDLAENNLSGTIPPCFDNLKAMATKRNSSERIIYSDWGGFFENAVVMTKGREFEYTTILTLMASLDLSSNNLSGEFPKEITSLLGLLSLNLSNNHLTGRIPEKIGDMLLLESLDFSRNQLSGKIPSSFSSMTFLNYLNLSYNNLSGEIPSSTQLQSLNASSFVGNNLCGPPLTQNCSANATTPDAENREEDEERDGSKAERLYLSMELGFVVGFWGVVGPIVFNKSWRCSYFWFLDHMWHKLCGSFSKFY